MGETSDRRIISRAPVLIEDTWKSRVAIRVRSSHCEERPGARRDLHHYLLSNAQEVKWRYLHVEVCCLSALAALGLIVGGASAQSKMDCGKAYKGVWDKLKREEFAKISDQQLADVNRLALRAYDACQAGDEQTAIGLFEEGCLIDQ